ncbi:hypothetical protein LMG9964_02204 [Paraburkholderia phenoliruptrix]|uniref:Transposase DDE domain-containing protein n=1 Tax=Paraburkholderia phenoliruptrix TaxID=252970 RepID=A0A6J5K2C3_9BURK|nr:hypothetical protein LMG9964_02204 [Paraburkholderia phenoliruptrix]
MSGTGTPPKTNGWHNLAQLRGPKLAGKLKVIRKRIEEHFGWGKTVGRIRQTAYRGLKRVDQHFKLTMLASNLTRMARMLTVVPQGAVQ